MEAVTSWHRIGVAQVLGEGVRTRFRCFLCHGAVVPQGQRGLTRAHIRHKRYHNGCQDSEGFCGRESRHPDALN